MGWNPLAGPHACLHGGSHIQGSHNKDLTLFQRFLQLKRPGHYSIRFVCSADKGSSHLRIRTCEAHEERKASDEARVAPLPLTPASHQVLLNKVQSPKDRSMKTLCLRAWFCIPPNSKRLTATALHSKRQTIASLTLPCAPSPLSEATKRITESVSGALWFPAGSWSVCDIHFDTNLN